MKFSAVCFFASAVCFFACALGVMSARIKSKMAPPDTTLQIELTDNADNELRGTQHDLQDATQYLKEIAEKLPQLEDLVTSDIQPQIDDFFAAAQDPEAQKPLLKNIKQTLKDVVEQLDEFDSSDALLKAVRLFWNVQVDEFDSRRDARDIKEVVAAASSNAIKEAAASSDAILTACSLNTATNKEAFDRLSQEYIRLAGEQIDKNFPRVSKVFTDSVAEAKKLAMSGKAVLDDSAELTTALSLAQKRSSEVVALVLDPETQKQMKASNDMALSLLKDFHETIAKARNELKSDDGQNKLKKAITETRVKVQAVLEQVQAAKSSDDVKKIALAEFQKAYETALTAAAQAVNPEDKKKFEELAQQALNSARAIAKTMAPGMEAELEKWVANQVDQFEGKPNSAKHLCASLVLPALMAMQSW